MDWRLIGAPAHWGLADSAGDTLMVFARGSNDELEVWETEDGRQWLSLSLGGDTADIPSYGVSPTRQGRIDAIYMTNTGVVVMGQRDGHVSSWLAALVR